MPGLERDQSHQLGVSGQLEKGQGGREMQLRAQKKLVSGPLSQD